MIRLFQLVLMTHLRDVFLCLNFFFSFLSTALASRRALLGSRAVLECDLNSVSNVPPSTSSRSTGTLDTTHGRSGNNQSNSNNGNINNPDSLIQVIVWYKGNITGAPIYSIDARSSGGSLESAAKFPAKSYGNRLTLNPTVRPIALVIDPVELEDDGDYFCRMVSTRCLINSFHHRATHQLQHLLYFLSFFFFSFFFFQLPSQLFSSSFFFFFFAHSHTFVDPFSAWNVASISHLFLLVVEFTLNWPESLGYHYQVTSVRQVKLWQVQCRR